MYNKIFTKILDSTVWLESNPTRIVWITFLACMDEEGFVALSSIGNVAARARVTMAEAEAAMATLEGPDSSDPSQEFSGRRVERVPYGWMVLNSKKYRDLVKRENEKALNRARVSEHREKKKAVMDVMKGNESVMQSEAVAVALASTKNAVSAPVGSGPVSSPGGSATPTKRPSFEISAMQQGAPAELPVEWSVWCAEHRPDIVPRETFDKFTVFWAARPAKSSRPIDWFERWQKWCAKEKAGKSTATWHAYSLAYSNRYGVEPVRNAKVSGMLSKFVDRVGASEAPAIAGFYVQSNRSIYVGSKHAVDLLLRDAEGLRTEWATGRAGTDTAARQADRSQSNLDAFAPLIAEARAKEAANAK